MCVHNLDHIARSLIQAGRDPDTPAAIIQMAYWDGQHVVTGTLRTIAEKVRRSEVQPPATLIVGEVVRLRDKLKFLMASRWEEEEVCI